MNSFVDSANPSISFPRGKCDSGLKTCGPDLTFLNFLTLKALANTHIKHGIGCGNEEFSPQARMCKKPEALEEFIHHLHEAKASVTDHPLPGVLHDKLIQAEVMHPAFWKTLRELSFSSFWIC